MSAQPSSPASASSGAPAALVSPFQRLNDLLAGVAPGRAPINLTVGEPRHPVPDFVGPVLAREIDGFGRYPAIRSTRAREIITEITPRLLAALAATDAVNKFFKYAKLAELCRQADAHDRRA